MEETPLRWITDKAVSGYANQLLNWAMSLQWEFSLEISNELYITILLKVRVYSWYITTMISLHIPLFFLALKEHNNNNWHCLLLIIIRF